MVKIINNGAGRPGLEIQGRMIHDPADPMAEAGRMTAGITGNQRVLVLVFGLGLGYHVQALADGLPRARLAVFDPHPEIHAAFEARRHSDFPLSRVTLLSNWDQLQKLLLDEVIHGDYDDPHLFFLPGYGGLFPEWKRDFDGVVLAARVRRAVNDKTLAEKGPVFLAHLADNLASVLDLPLITGLKDRFKGYPGFIVGSGPGLEENIGHLREARRRGIILAAGSAVKPILAAGVAPHVVVVVEAEDTRSFLDVGPGNEDMVLAAASAAHPGHFQVNGYHRAVFHATYGAAFLFGEDQFAPGAGNAGSAAFSLGLMLGLNPLVIVGQDHAFGPDKLHAAGTPGEATLTPDLAGYSVEGLHGRLVPTHSGLAASLHWYAESIRYIHQNEQQMTVINATERGARIPGIPDVPLADVLAGLSSHGPPPEPHALLAGLKKPDAAGLRQGLETIWRILSRTGMLMRLSMDQAKPFIEEYRKGHPFLRMALAGIDLADNGRVKDRLEEIESQVLKMLDVMESRYGG